MGIDHVVVALIHRQVDGLAHCATRVVQIGARIGELHEVFEIGNRAIAPSAIEIADKGRAIGGRKDHRIAADLHRAGRIARMLDIFAGRALLDQSPTHAAREAHPLPIHIGARRLPDFEAFRIVFEVEPDLQQHRIGIVFNQRQALLVQHLIDRRLAGDEGG